MSIFRRSGQKHAVAIAMTGVKLGDRLLQFGGTDLSLLTALSAKVGMSGRACVQATDSNEAARVRLGAERAGVLLEVEIASPSRFPFDDGTFDLVVIDNQDGQIARMKPERRVATLQQARRILMPRGRIVVIERAPRAGLGALLGRTTTAADPHYQDTGGAVTALRAEGFKAVRRLADTDGLSFFEGIA